MGDFNGQIRIIRDPMMEETNSWAVKKKNPARREKFSDRRRKEKWIYESTVGKIKSAKPVGIFCLYRAGGKVEVVIVPPFEK